MSKEEKIVDWIISSMIYSLMFSFFTQCGLAFILVGIYIPEVLYIIVGIGWWVTAILALIFIRKKLKNDLEALA
ncbi:MAG: hypothetical protein GWO20_11390 [Candidatus Korarchaeota archaeon]|nr:hypothetical protein [Candidatus Korarchaeota archaeon]NIU82921.1 hypothetical protein [Candidatus Thorarchaeota archaeon]NIW14187.1 hypothetical protein [Candidatus Thorarchaeota archaeon]NIW52295.1 hypothetical protein [Candidatus Korarchaeota archaeon]